MTTRNQTMEQRIQEQEIAMLRLESATTKNAEEIEGMKILIVKSSENVEVMKNQMEAQMNELLQSFQSIRNGYSHEGISNPRSMVGVQGNQAYNSNNSRLTKMEFPKFNGENIEGWLCRVEHFFAIDFTPDNLKVRYAIVHLEDIALLWHQSFVQSRGGSIEGMCWLDYKNAISARFGEIMGQDAMGALASLKQSGTIKEFCKEFDLALTKVTICDEYAVSLFLRALKPEIGYPLRLLRPKSLPEAYLLARIQEEAVSVGSGGYRYGKSSYSGNTTYRNSDYSQKSITNGSSSSAILPTPVLKPKPLNSRRLSHKEIEEKRARGECFGCTEKYSPTHVCKNKQLFSIELLEDDDELMDQDEVIEVIEPKISLNAITGVPSFSTMRVKGSIGTKILQILVDSGSTHNFVSIALAKKMRCPIKTVDELDVTVADGNKLGCSQLCKDFQWLMQGHWFKTDVMVIPLLSYDLVLGVQWLHTLNDIVWNFKNLTMQFKVGDQIFNLKGIGSNDVSECSAEKMQALLHNMTGLASIQLFSMQTDNPSVFQHTPNVEQTDTSADLEKLLNKYVDVFNTPTTLPPKRKCDHKIVLKDENVTINQRAYRYPAAQKDVLEQLTQELLDAGTIRNSQSSFASPVVLVKKKDGTWRFCVDYRQLNEATVKDRFPIPLIEELLDELGQASVFSKLDLRAGYHQIRMADNDVHKTAFRTHQGLFEFVVMPFGLTNAPATFQSLMNSTFKDLMRKCTLVFFDDILVYSSTMEQHLSDLEKVLSLLRKDSLYAKMSKCSFAGSNVEYLGHIISAKGVQTDPKKVSAVQQWPYPTTLKQLRGFLGLAGYYRRFIKSFGELARPLTDLTKKNAFHWSEEAAIAFDKLKAALTSAPVLALPDFSREFVIETDASSKGMGAVLMQNGHPLAFISKALSIKQQALSVYEKELLAILMAVKHWHHYLIPKKFLIRTDQKSLRYLLTQKITTPLQQTWLAKLMGYSYEIMYKKGSENVAADGLSRMSGLALFATSLNTFDSQLVKRLQSAWEQDVKLSAIIQQLKEGQMVSLATWDGEFLRRKTKIWVGNDLQLQKDIIKMFHASPIGGHSGYVPTLKKVKSFYYWKGCSKMVYQMVRECSQCQLAKYEPIASPGLLQPLPVPTHIFTDITMDFISGLPKSQGKEVILVVVDRLTKYVHFLPLSHPYTAVQVATVFMDGVFKLHGCPLHIVSDRDSVFLSHFWTEFMRLQGVQLAHSTAFHPQSDGQTEVVNRCLETYLRCMCMNQPKDWMKWLSLAEWWFNTTYHSSLKMCPFEALYGYPPPLHLPYIANDTSVEAVEVFHRDREAMVRHLKSLLAGVRNRMKQQADKHRTDRVFQVGDWVFLKLQPYVQTSLRQFKYSKLGPKYFGPFLVIEKVGQVAYKLDLPNEAQIHPVFHVSLLKPARGNHATLVPLPTTPRFFLQPRAIIDRRVVKSHNKAVVQVLVHWTGLSPSEATWENFNEFVLRFPDFNS